MNINWAKFRYNPINLDTLTIHLNELIKGVCEKTKLEFLARNWKTSAFFVPHQSSYQRRHAEDQ